MNYELEIINLKKRIAELESIILKTNNEKPQKNKQSNRDKTKYMFEGKIYPKNRLISPNVFTLMRISAQSYI